jgi:hypothetical protein
MGTNRIEAPNVLSILRYVTDLPGYLLKKSNMGYTMLVNPYLGHSGAHILLLSLDFLFMLTIRFLQETPDNIVMQSQKLLLYAFAV